MAGYDFSAIEKKWQSYWERNDTFCQPNPGDEGFVDRPKMYVLDMFPYPSGAGLHVGHPEGYTATDIVARYLRMKGVNVLHPMGYDAFGLPAQQYAVEHGIHPRVTTGRNIANIERQIKMFGFSYDWSRRLSTTDPDYYRWTQWIFLKMFNSWYDPEAGAARPIKELLDKLLSGQLVVDYGGNPVAPTLTGQLPDLLVGRPDGPARCYELEPAQLRAVIDNQRLAYMAEVPVNWCPKLGTVLANEEVTNEGRSERGDHPVYRRALTQWMLRITAYADRLLADLDPLDWPESVKIMQRNWIGKSKGAEVDFPVLGSTAFPGCVDQGSTAFPGCVDQGSTAFPGCVEGKQVTLRPVPNEEFKRLAEFFEGDRPSLLARTFEGCDPYPPGQPITPDLMKSIRNLPHVTVPGATYFVTFHTCERAILTPQDRDVVFNAMLHWAGEKCAVYAAVVLNDHAHMIIRPLPGYDLSKILQSIKGFSAREINRRARIKGHVWQQESFDHIIRDTNWFTRFVYYICDNPAKRELTKRADEYPWIYVDGNEISTEAGAPFGHRLESSEGTAWKSCATSDEFFKTRTEGGYPAVEEEDVIRVYTTRPDTLFGATYMVLAPEHPLVERITTADRRREVDAYVATAVRKSELERMAETKEKTGVFTGAFAVNPVNRQPIQVWVADYVMMGYGTGAIMAVPAHDTRDFEFATKFDLPIVQVVQPPGDQDWHGYVDDGTAVNSGKYDGLTTAEFSKRITEDLETAGLGRGAVNYKLRDWVFSRQWYWGEPFPIVHCPECGTVGVGEDQLPLELPEMDDFTPVCSDDPDAAPEPPLGRLTDWADTTCPRCNGQARRELNAMPQWAGSCWYYLRFLDPRNDKVICDPKIEKYWMGEKGVDLYVGGAEHAVLHLLYARFWHKVLYDLGCVSTPEPFGRLFNQGMIRSFAYRDKRGVYVGYDDVDLTGEKPRHMKTGEQLSESIEKMSKSLKNVVNPDEVIGQYGADTFRLYEMFMGPLESSKPWNTRDVPGVQRFLWRVWRMILGSENQPPLLAGGTTGVSSLRDVSPVSPDNTDQTTAPADVERALHKLIKKVGEDIEVMKFNTAIAAMMEFVNVVFKAGRISADQAGRFVLVLAPFAPHVAEELWQKLGHDGSLAHEDFPTYDEAMLVAETIELPVQINGKLRARISVPADASGDDVIAAALAKPKIAAAVAGRNVVKKIVVPGRLVNLVVK